MNSPSDELNERLRKAREEARKRMVGSGGLGQTPKKPKRPTFVEYATMYKLESRPRPAITFDETPRQLQCVSCGTLLLWSIYTLNPLGFDRGCEVCKVQAKDFYKGKSCKELNDA